MSVDVDVGVVFCSGAGASAGGRSLGVLWQGIVLIRCRKDYFTDGNQPQNHHYSLTCPFIN